MQHLRYCDQHWDKLAADAENATSAPQEELSNWLAPIRNRRFG